MWLKNHYIRITWWRSLETSISTMWLESEEQLGSGSQHVALSPGELRFLQTHQEERWVGARHLYFKNTCHVESEAQEGVEQLLWVFYHMPGPGAPDLGSLISTNSLPAASLPFFPNCGEKPFYSQNSFSLSVLDHSLSFWESAVLGNQHNNQQVSYNTRGHMQQSLHSSWCRPFPGPESDHVCSRRFSFEM